MINLLYERVPYHYDAEVGILDQPVMEIHEIKAGEDFRNVTIDEIPKGKYIVCAQILEVENYISEEESYECIDVIIDKYSGHSK